MVEIDGFGELRAALEVSRKDPGQFGWVVFALAILDDERQRAGIEKVRRELGGEPYQGATLAEWAEWAAQGAPALAARLEEAAPWLTAPRRVAAAWLAAWSWQCAIKHHEHPDDGMHVCMGIGFDRVLIMQWDVMIEPSPRYVAIVPGHFPFRRLNTHAAMNGYPGLPAHLDAIIEASIDRDFGG